MLVISDCRGIPLAYSEAISGNHNDAYELVETVENMLKNIRAANIRTDGLFLNADAGFDTSEFRLSCFKNDIIGNIDINKRNGQ